MHQGPSNAKAKEAPPLMRRGPQWSQCDGGPRPNAVEAHAIHLQKRPTLRCSTGPKGSKATEAPALMRQGPGQSKCERGCGPDAVGPQRLQSDGGPRHAVAGPLSIPLCKRPTLSSGGPGNPTAKEAPARMRRGPQELQSGLKVAKGPALLRQLPVQSQSQTGPNLDAPGAPAIQM